MDYNEETRFLEQTFDTVEQAGAFIDGVLYVNDSALHIQAWWDTPNERGEYIVQIADQDYTPDKDDS